MENLAKTSSLNKSQSYPCLNLAYHIIIVML